MHEEGSSQLSVKDMVKRIGILIAVSAGAGILGAKTVFEVHQATAVAVFLAIILGTLLFWNIRLAIAFLGLSVLICSNSLKAERPDSASGAPTLCGSIPSSAPA